MQNIEPLFVGGCVRDWSNPSAGEPVDIDMLLEANIEDHEAVFAELGWEPMNNGSWVLDFDRRTAKANHPEFGVVDVKFCDCAHSDLFHRDFTVNAMALHEDGSFVDPFNGLQDLEDHVLRMIPDKTLEDTFAPSPERLIRLARFHQAHGFDIDAPLVEAFGDPHILAMLSELDANIKINQLNKWVSNVGWLNVMMFLSEFADFRSAVFSNVNPKFVPGA